MNVTAILISMISFVLGIFATRIVMGHEYDDLILSKMRDKVIGQIVDFLDRTRIEPDEWKGCVLSPRDNVKDLRECYDPDTIMGHAVLALIPAIEKLKSPTPSQDRKTL